MFNLCLMPNICDRILTSVEKTILNPAGTCFMPVSSPVLRSTFTLDVLYYFKNT